MELKALIKIFAKYKKMFWSIILLFLIGGCLFYILQPRNYIVSTTVNIVRLNLNKNLDDNKKEFENDFSSFYRAQADDKVADSIVAWLKSPSIVSDILTKSNRKDLSNMSIEDLSAMYDVNKISAQVVDVRFKVLNSKDGTKQVDAINKKINKLLKQMTPESSTNSWFRVSVQKPVIRFNEKSPLFIFLMSLVLGFFVSFCVVVFINYLKEEE